MQHSQASPIAVWRRPAKLTAHTPVVVFLHGRGADEHDLISLADRLPSAFAYVSVRGPVPAEGGYTWFESRGPGRPVAKSIRSSVGTLRAWLDDQPELARRARVFPCGFSAGMMMAGALVLEEPQRFSGAVLLSGVLPLEAGFPAEPGRLASLPIFVGRGALDDVIPAPLVAQTDAYLRERSGADLCVREYPHAHSISPREIADIAIWLNERV